MGQHKLNAQPKGMEYRESQRASQAPRGAYCKKAEPKPKWFLKHGFKLKEEPEASNENPTDQS